MFKKILLILLVGLLFISTVNASEINNETIMTDNSHTSNFEDLAKEINSTLSGETLVLNSDHAQSSNCLSDNNEGKDLFWNTEKSFINNSTFALPSDIVSAYDLESSDVGFALEGTFDELSYKINNTPEGGILILDKDYEFKSGGNKGILISKAITIDGAGHFLNGNKLSRMFNITSDNVTLKNINFINGNAYGKYFSNDVGGGAIYWIGNNGYLENCNLFNNSGFGIEDDPFDKEEIIETEDGMIIHVIRMRPAGAKTNEGGAIVWKGDNGTVNNCVFKENHVSYPDCGGAICWSGNSGKVIQSEFYYNGAWLGSGISWFGNNGSIISSSFLSDSIGSGIYWAGKNGTLSNSILLELFRDNMLVSSENVSAENNWWGDTLDNFNQIIKRQSVKNWVVLNLTSNRNHVEIGDEITIRCDLRYLTNLSNVIVKDNSLKFANFSLFLNNGDELELVNGVGEYKFKANGTGTLKLDLEKNILTIRIDADGSKPENGTVSQNTAENSTNSSYNIITIHNAKEANLDKTEKNIAKAIKRNNKINEIKIDSLKTVLNSKKASISNDFSNFDDSESSEHSNYFANIDDSGFDGNDNALLKIIHDLLDLFLKFILSLIEFISNSFFN